MQLSIDRHYSWSMQVLQKPEARSLILAMTPVVVAEGVRSGMFCTRDLLLGKDSGSAAALQHPQGSLRLPAWVTGMVAMLVMLWLAFRMQNVSAFQIV